MKSNRTESVALGGFILSVSLAALAVLVLIPVFMELAQVLKTVAAALHVVSTVN